MTDRVGQQLGHYRLIRLLGRGGFAEVYLCEHLRLKTQVAVKILHTSLDDDDIEGFLREARTVAHLKHPNIVRVFDFDVENQTPYLVMDYLPNGNVRRSNAKGTPLPLETVVSYVKQVASALQYAHDQKLIHRDIKPENMLLDRDSTIVLSDFGIALMSQSSRYQNTQEVAGTAAYMAPEQFQGHPQRASDQYALGVVVYEWLTGDRPFHGSFTEIASQHLFVTPLPLCEKVPAISPEVEQVVLTALEKDPHKRFRSVQAFATALEQACQPAQSHQVAFPKDVPFPSEASLPGDGIVATSPNGELSPSQLVQTPVMNTTPGQAAPQALLSSPEVSYASNGISRRSTILGLGLAGLTVVGGGIALLLLSHTQGPQVASSLSTPPPTARPTSAPTARLTPSPTAHPTSAPTVRPTPSPTIRPTSAPTITSILQGTVATPPSQVNLTSEGISNWIHWGLYPGGTVDRKNGVPQQISTFSTIGNGTARSYNNNGVAFSWSDGTPDSAITNTPTGVYVNGVNNGFSFAVPTNTTIQTLRVYVDVWLSQGKFTASLTDGSGLVYTDESLNNTGGTTQAVYTLTYRSSLHGYYLTITFVEVNTYYSGSNVALQAATLQ